MKMYYKEIRAKIIFWVAKELPYVAIMQIIHGGKLLQLQHLVEIHGKTFAIVSFLQYLID